MRPDPVMTPSTAEDNRDPANAAVSVDLIPGSFVIERYKPDGASIQWLAEVVGEDGNLWLMRPCKTRREALDVIDKHGTAAARNAHD